MIHTTTKQQHQQTKTQQTTTTTMPSTQSQAAMTYHVVITAITGKCLPSSPWSEESSLDDDFPSKCAQMNGGQQSHTPPFSKARTKSQPKHMLCTSLINFMIVR